jgi:hypothetical protein
MMEGKLHELLLILNAEYDVFVRCLQRLNERQRFMTSDNVVEPETYRGSLTDLVREAAELEARRVSVIETISRDMDLTCENRSVRELLENLKGTRSGRFAGLKRTIVEAYDKAERQKRRNDTLIRQSMDIMEKTGYQISRTDIIGTAGLTCDEMSRAKETVGDRTEV